MKWLLGLVALVAVAFFVLIKNSPIPERQAPAHPPAVAAPPAPPPELPFTAKVQPATMDAVKRLFTDNDPRTRLAAFDIAYQAKDMMGLRQLDAMLVNEADPHVTAAALQIPAKAKDPEALPILVKAMRHYNVEVRVAAVNAVGSYRDPRAANVLAAAQKDPEPRVRAAASAALSLLQSAPAQAAAAPSAAAPRR